MTYVMIDGIPTIAGSNGGSERPPAWLLNLRADPRAEVRFGRRRLLVVALEIEPGSPTFVRAWKSLNELRGGRYDSYQAVTERPIPLVQLQIIEDETERRTLT